MSLLSEEYRTEQVMATAQMLQQLENDENKHMKKLYNIKLLNWLESQETEWEVNQDFKTSYFKPEKFKTMKYEIGQYKRFN